MTTLPPRITHVFKTCLRGTMDNAACEFHYVTTYTLCPCIILFMLFISSEIRSSSNEVVVIEGG